LVERVWQETCARQPTGRATRGLNRTDEVLRFPIAAALGVAPYIQQYGYLAVFVGGMLEGETVLILAGYSVSRGYLDFLPVLLLAAAGGVAGDFLYFSLGRHYGPGIIRGFPSLRRVRGRTILLARRWGRMAAFVTRFAYGLRVALPMTMGAAKMRPSVFLAFNTLGALSFAVFYLTLGYLFGELLQETLGRVRPYERQIVAGVLFTGVLAWAIRRWWLVRSADEITRAAAEELRRARKSGE
jgi:membrane protein DedA with SNARE-associated domain